MTPNPQAIEIKLRRAARLLEVTFEDGSRFELPFEYLRVYSPSAEVKGHGPGQETLVLGKEAVGVRAVEPVGQYAVKLVFDDGHDTGLFTWKYLYELGRDREENWSRTWPGSKPWAARHLKLVDRSQGEEPAHGATLVESRIVRVEVRPRAVGLNVHGRLFVE